MTGNCHISTQSLRLSIRRWKHIVFQTKNYYYYYYHY